MLHLVSLEQADLDNTWLTIGSFDGVHRGHQEIISHMVSAAHTAGATAVVLTFHPHPAVVLGKREIPYSLTAPQERANLLGQLGVDVVITQTFDLELANTAAPDYIKQLKNSLDLHMLWVGQDFALGHNREGDVAALRRMGAEMGFGIQVFDPVRIDDQIISSSQIRKLLKEGNVRQSAELLGRNYTIMGVVVPGDQRGRTIGIPTANLQIDAEKMVPANGVYACRAYVSGQAWPAATNIGVRPTFDGKSSVQHVEAHLIDFDGDLYGQQLQLEFIERLRSEQRFAGFEELVIQIHKDIALTRQLIQPIAES
jgi:riboflavin kinase/FMN adenylyltransferase